MTTLQALPLPSNFEDLCELFLLYIAYSTLGWCGEMLYCSIPKGHICEKRGFLNGFLCPIYGHGALLVLYLLHGGFQNPVLTFIFGAIVTSILEYFTSWIMEKLFHMRWWDYSNCKYQINGRICLTNCIFFGLGCVLLCHVVNPPVLRWLMGIGPEYTVPVASFIFGLYIMDNVLSIRSAFQLSHRLDKLQKLQQEIRQHLDEKAQLYGNRVEELTVRLMNGLEKASDEYLQERMLRLAQLRSGADVFERRLLRSHPNLRSKRHGKLIDVLRQKKDGVVKK